MRRSIRRSTRLVAATAAATLALAACGGDDADTTAEDTGADVESTESADDGDMAEDDDAMAEGDDMEEMGGDMEEMGGDYALLTDGTLVVCSDIPYAPFEFEDPDAEDGYTGFDIELVRDIADKLGLTAEIKPLGFDPIASGAALNGNQCDLAASAITITEEREENVDFTDPYVEIDQSLLVAADAEAQTLADFSGKRLGVQSSTTGESYATENAPEGTEVVGFENPGDLLTALVAGQVDGVLQDLPVNEAKASEGDEFVIAETFQTDEEYGFAVAEEGRDALLADINAALAELIEDGTRDALVEEFFAA